jgi:mRNA interferase RelE/StbE
VSGWKLEYRDKAREQLRGIDKVAALRIARFLKDRVINSVNPRQQGIAMQGRYRGYWRYRVGEYRIICDIQGEVVTVLVLVIGHRKGVYE